MEIINCINENLSILEETGGLRFGMDAYLLASFVRRNSKKKVLETCCGSGVISLLLLAKNKCSSAICVDVQDQATRLCALNAAENGFADKIDVMCCDVKDLKFKLDFEVCVFNPPYMRASSGKVSDRTESYIARHESTATIYDFMECAGRCVKDGGEIYVVYTPDRLSELLNAASRCGVEPKRLTLVYPTTAHRPCLVLLQCKNKGAPGMTVTKPLIIYGDVPGGEYSEDMKYIYDNLEFPEEYMK